MERKRILVVDGHRDAAESLCVLLELNGYATSVAFDGATALEIAAARHPDVVILDIRLPQLRGTEVCRRLRAEEWGRRARIIVMTASGRQEDRAAAHAAGCDVYLVKPVQLKRLERYFRVRPHPPEEVPGGCRASVRRKPLRPVWRSSDS